MRRLRAENAMVLRTDRRALYIYVESQWINVLVTVAGGNHHTKHKNLRPIGQGRGKRQSDSWGQCFSPDDTRKHWVGSRNEMSWSSRVQMSYYTIWVEVLAAMLVALWGCALSSVLVLACKHAHSESGNMLTLSRYNFNTMFNILV